MAAPGGGDERRATPRLRWYFATSIRVAEQRTDQEIASALFLSLRTVNWHVSSILAKLDCTSRREAVVRARNLGLI